MPSEDQESESKLKDLLKFEFQVIPLKKISLQEFDSKVLKFAK